MDDLDPKINADVEDTYRQLNQLHEYINESKKRNEKGETIIEEQK